MRNTVATPAITPDQIDTSNARLEAEAVRDYAHLGEQLARRGIDVEAVLAEVMAFSVAVPSWGLGTGGTRFGRYPIAGGPNTLFEKIEDCAVIQQLTQATPRVSLHFPWDKVKDYDELKGFAAAQGLGFDAVNSNTFQDQAGQGLSYKFGSLTHADAATRQQAIDHNLECIEIGQKLDAKALTVWLGDGSNFAGQSDFTRALERYLDSMAVVYAGLPDDWRVFMEHKLYEPAFYSTVIQDWGTSILCAQKLGPKAQCLVDLGHHAPNVNIEMIVARLSQFGKLGGFHFNDSKYGDDDLDAGSVNPFQLFLVFNELVEAKSRDPHGFDPAYMLDQSHNITDPIESLMMSVGSIEQALTRALLIDRVTLRGYQDGNDPLMAHATLKEAYDTDVRPILKIARLRVGAAIDPVGVYRASGYRAQKAAIRITQGATGGGIV
ncbi:L-rhamnose catabolism isomerase [Asticcacaulis endophyticus]|uniref:Sugar isomerase R00627 n=1 Tax=Asticcacaulis endophyticus TaxID=1395890 RepID=A0A918PUG1_9CAUL|nr:L-rhamnose catabolism isomerase [Asticcacaulis endophyticus]GGZ20942.1 putative sugar isomerase R00627 [Asticcacaulis endophyticus]